MRSRGGYVNTLQVTDRIPFFFFSEVGPLLVVVVVLAMNQNRLNGTFIIIIFIFTYRTACSSNSALRGSLLQGPVFRSYEKYMNLFLCSSSAPFHERMDETTRRLSSDCWRCYGIRITGGPVPQKISDNESTLSVLSAAATTVQIKTANR